MEQIAEQVGCRPELVREVVGAPSAWRERMSRRDERVVAVYVAGRTIAETATITGVRRTQVGRIVQRAGVSRGRGPVPGRGDGSTGS